MQKETGSAIQDAAHPSTYQSSLVQHIPVHIRAPCSIPTVACCWLNSEQAQNLLPIGLGRCI